MRRRPGKSMGDLLAHHPLQLVTARRQSRRMPRFGKQHNRIGEPRNSHSADGCQ